MNTTTKKILSLTFLFAFFVVPVVAIGQTDAFSADRGQSGSGLATTSVYEIMVAIMKWLLIIITVLAVIGFIISGIYFITAGGSGRADDAKQWLTYSIIGIIVALIGYIVVTLVDSLLGGTAQV